MSNSSISVPNMDAATLHAATLPVLRTETHIFFFGYSGPDPEVCFQQWYPSPFVDESVEGKLEFRTSEHYMMYRKALLFGDMGTVERILEARSPREAKVLGRGVANFTQALWDESCDAIVEQGNFLKFNQNPELGKILLGTGEMEIVEASPSDRIWGIGFDAEHAVGREGEWGRNGLGRALMVVRGRLRVVEN